VLIIEAVDQGPTLQKPIAPFLATFVFTAPGIPDAFAVITGAILLKFHFVHFLSVLAHIGGTGPFPKNTALRRTPGTRLLAAPAEDHRPKRAQVKQVCGGPV